MALDCGQPTKQVETILGQSEELLKIVADFQGRLDNRFRRHPMEEATSETKITQGNVLDEVIENLMEGNARLTRIMSFVSSDVLPKIS